MKLLSYTGRTSLSRSYETYVTIYGMYMRTGCKIYRIFTLKNMNSMPIVPQFLSVEYTS